MMNKAKEYEAFLDELAPVVDGEARALERHADLLAEHDEARDLRYEAASAAEAIGAAGADYVPPDDLVMRVLAGLDGAETVGRTTSPGFAMPDRQSVETLGVEAEAVSEASSESEPADEPAVHDAPDRIEPAEKRKENEKKGLVWLGPAFGAAALAAAALLAFSMTGSDSGDDAPEPTIATRGIEGTLEMVERAAVDGQSGVTVRRPSSTEFVALSAGEPLAMGSIVRTDERTRARVTLSDGSDLVLNHDTELELVGETPRTLRVRRGALVADIAHLAGAPNAFFHTPAGKVEVLGTKFELTATDEVTSVRVTRGVVSLESASGKSEVRAGEEGVVQVGGGPEVAPVTGLASTIAWSELGVEPEEDEALPGIGSLRARRPGERQERERPLAVASQKVTVRIVGNVARTEIEQVFRNDGDHTLEGIYSFPLPPDAQIARLALDVEGRMEEGSFLERDRAAQIWRGVIRNATAPRQRQKNEEFIWVPGPWHDPALLEWQRGGQFELRIFPIPAHGERRVILAYTQTVPPHGTQRSYRYPLAHAVDGSTSVGRFEVDVRVAGAEHVRASGYRVTSAREEDATRLHLRSDGFVPKGDLTIEYELPGAERELSFWTYRGQAAVAPPENSREQDREVQDAQRALAEDERGYVAFALRPRLPRATERRDRDYVLVVDASQSMVGERYERAARLASEMVAEMDRRDRFAVLACDYGCRAFPGGVQAPSGDAARRAREWLASIEPAGASDLVAALRDAVANVEGERRQGRELNVIYVGDGVSTVGYRRASSLSAEVSALSSGKNVVVSSVGIGGDADTLALSAIARASGGHYVPYLPGQRLSVAAARVLETSYGVSLTSPRVELPAGLSDSAPSALPTMRAGQELVVVARMERERVQGDVVLRGEVAGRPFEQRYEVELVGTDAAGNRFVPRLWAAAQIDELQLRGRGDERARIVAMSKAFGVMSRHTSLLVLESEAMFRAFRVDRNTSPVAGWTGEEDVVAGGADGSLDVLEEGEAGGGRLDARSRRRAQGPVSLPMRLGGGGGRAAPAEPSSDALFGLSGLAGPVAAEAPTASGASRMARRPAPRPRSGRWMREVWVRTGAIDARSDVSEAHRAAAHEAEVALRENGDSRDRHRDAVQKLSRAGELDRALEVADAWIERDRLDPEALTAKADILGRLGRRDEALRLLTGTVDLAPNSEVLHTRLADAFERAERPERACAHRIALAENDQSDARALAAALRCERALGRDAAAERLMAGVREPRVRVQAERLAEREARDVRFGGDFTIEGEWDGDVDLDIGIVTSQGTRLSWMGGRQTVRGEDATGRGRERLGLRYTGAGTYYVEVSRTDDSDLDEVRGTLRIRVLGQTRTVPFTLRDANETVARVQVRRERRLVPASGPPR